MTFEEAVQSCRDGGAIFQSDYQGLLFWKDKGFRITIIVEPSDEGADDWEVINPPPDEMGNDELFIP